MKFVDYIRLVEKRGNADRYPIREYWIGNKRYVPEATHPKNLHMIGPGKDLHGKAYYDWFDGNVPRGKE